MSEVKFNYGGAIIDIQCNSNEKMEDIIKRYAIKSCLKIEDLYFIYNGAILKENATFNEQVNQTDKTRNKMMVLVNKKSEEGGENESQSLKKSEYIICPTCKESAKLYINDYKIDIVECKNSHKVKNILIKNYPKTQYYDEAKIKCEICNISNKNNSYNHIFYICLDCKKNICPICKEKHDKTHNVINYEEKSFTCDLHYEQFYTYCASCRKDICMTCQMEHENHKIIYYIPPNLKKIKEEGDNLFNQKEELKSEINNIIMKLNNLIDMIDNYYEIYDDIIKSYGHKKRNYYLLQNIENITKFNSDFIKDIYKIINEKEFSYKIKNIFEMHDKMNSINDNIINNITNRKNNININKKSKKIQKNEIIEDYIDKETKIVKEIVKDKTNRKYKNEEKYFDNKNNSDNYKNFDISKMKEIKNIKPLYDYTTNIFALKDGRIIAYSNENNQSKDNYKNAVYNFENSNVIDLKLYYIDEIVQMDDGNVVIRIGKEIRLIDIQEKNFLLRQSFNLDLASETKKMIKLSNQKILFSDYVNNYIIYLYNNNQLTLLEKKNLKIITYKYIIQIIAIKEKEIGIFLENYPDYIIQFYDLEKNKIIKSCNCKGYKDVFGLINENLLICGSGNSFFPVNLKTYKTGKEFRLSNSFKDINIYSIFPLNEKQFIIAQYGFINQFELKDNNEFSCIHVKEIRNSAISKYPSNRIVFKDIKYSNIIYLYG